MSTVENARPPIQWVYDDGGRASAGFKGEANDCVCRAIAIVTQKPYPEVYESLNAVGRSESPKRTKHSSRPRQSSARTGIFKRTTRAYIQSLGWKWTPTMQIGQGCKVHLRSAELPSGRLLVAVSRHVVAVIDGVIHDTHDCSRGGMRCVYGYYSEQERAA